MSPTAVREQCFRLRRLAHMKNARSKPRLLALVGVAEAACKVVEDTIARGGITTQATVELEQRLDHLSRVLPPRLTSTSDAETLAAAIRAVCDPQ